MERYASESELPSDFSKVLLAAKEATHNSYAPHSGFYVGAAVLFEDGTILKGNNQENLAFPSGLCAERVVLFYSRANFPDKPIKAIAVTARSKNGIVDTPVTPCGGCRQVMVEYEQNQKKPIQVILAGEKGDIFISENTCQLLPFLFDSELVGSSEK